MDLVTVLSIAALVLGAVLGYFLWQQSVQTQALQDQLGVVGQTLELVARRLDGNGDQLASLQSRQEVTMERVGVTQRDLARAQELAVQLKEEQVRSVVALTEEIALKADTQQVAEFQEEAGQKFEGVDEEISTVKDSVASNQKELTDTLAQLTELGVRVTEHGNMIATTSDGLDELIRRGEREYVTFDFRKKRKAKVGAISVELRKADTKRQRADLHIFVDDRKMERKNINVNTPVNFYVGTEKVNYELVINQVLKDEIKGYVSVPKGKLPPGTPALETPQEPEVSMVNPAG
jgi:chromosome segregation ATPase